MRRVVLALAVGMAGLLLVGASSCDTGTSTSSSSSGGGGSATSDSSTSAAAPTPTAAPTTRFSLSGSGTKNTTDFTVPDEWTLDYTYDCSNAGGQGNFQVFAYNSDGSLDPNGPTVNELGAKGDSSTAAHNDAGSKYLTINSECSWTVKVVG